MISINRLRNRKSDFAVNNWLLDSGAFTEFSRFGHYRHSVQEYAECICGVLIAWRGRSLQDGREETGMIGERHGRLWRRWRTRYCEKQNYHMYGKMGITVPGRQVEFRSQDLSHYW
jgi:hypothetical protein